MPSFHRVFRRAATVAALATTAALLAATPAAATAPTASYVTIVGGGDYVGGSTSRLYRADVDSFGVSGTADRLQISVQHSAPNSWFYVTLSAPTGQVLAPGTYENAARSATPGAPGIDVFGEGRGCNTVSGRFVVRDVHVGGDGVIDRFSGTYESHCEGGVLSTIGEISVNEPTDGELVVANAAIDFPEAYPGVTGRVVPVYLVNVGAVERSVTATAFGGATPADFAVTANGCATVAPSASCQVNVRFTAGAAGPRSATLTLTDTSTAGSHAVALTGTGIPGHTSFRLRSDEGDYVGGGQAYDYTPADATLQASGTNTRVSMGVTVGYNGWSAVLTAPSGDLLQTGRTYTTAGGAGLSVSGFSRSCSTSTGSFTITEIAFKVDGSLERLSANVDQHCESSTSTLRAFLAWRATEANVPSPAPVLAVANFVAYPDSTSVVLAWDNPSSQWFESAHVRGAVGLVAPATPTSGVEVYDGTGESVYVGYLAPGETYSFSVWARNVDGVYGVRRILTVNGSDLALTVSPSTITYGGTTTITVRLVQGSNGAALSGKDVDLYVRKKGTRSYEWLDTLTTNASGVASIVIAPPYNVEVQATYYGEHGHLGATAGPVGVAVKHWVGASLSRTSVPRNGYATLTAAVSPNHYGKTVYLQRYYSGSWHTVASHALGTTSKYGFVLHPTTPGSYQYRVYMPGDADHAAGYSASRTLTVT